MKKISYMLLAACTVLAAGCSKNTGVGGAAGEATPATIQANTQLAKDLKLGDQQDFEDASAALLPDPMAKCCPQTEPYCTTTTPTSSLKGKPRTRSIRAYGVTRY